MAQFLPFAWCGIFRNDLHALFNERSSAEKYAADSHGVLVPLYDLRALEPKTEIEEPRDET